MQIEPERSIPHGSGPNLSEGFHLPEEELKERTLEAGAPVV
jgi:hypothetical protein